MQIRFSIAIWQITIKDLRLLANYQHELSQCEGMKSNLGPDTVYFIWLKLTVKHHTDTYKRS